jgi:hypothetical protein
MWTATVGGPVCPNGGTPGCPTRMLNHESLPGAARPEAQRNFGNWLRTFIDFMRNPLGTPQACVYRRLLKMTLEQLRLLEQQIRQLDRELATLLHPHQDAVQRLAEVGVWKIPGRVIG